MTRTNLHVLGGRKSVFLATAWEKSKTFRSLKSHPVWNLCYGWNSRLNFTLASCYPGTMLNKFLFLTASSTNGGAAFCQLTQPREDEGEISPIRGQAEVITTTPKLKQMENGAQHVSTSTVGFISLGHVFSCFSRLEECQTFEFCCFNKTKCGSAVLRRTTQHRR